MAYDLTTRDGFAREFERVRQQRPDLDPAAIHDTLMSRAKVLILETMLKRRRR
jgi:hypothetical protein